ncbi:MAG TPA: 1-acyl-sn-glycerol-3-phosphate acyltransferase [Desulfobacteraceae bacterium]|jgi:1-acyl-sn-glycerol-3-phosphate acyltransferase|nr:1-acyl-sn-glycerol-3-phosphate acyltransferase [Desulfobacteraceae bacterium]
MIRFVFLNLAIALLTILFSIIALVVSLFDRKGGRLVHFSAAVPWARAILAVSGIKVRIEEIERVDGTVPRIYMSNHQSAFDIFVLLVSLPVDFKFIMKEELMKIPLFGFACRRAGYIGIVRDDPRKAVKSMERAAERIRRGASVLVFPEGTRSEDGQLQSFKKGGFHLALRAGCDIVPVTIIGTSKIMRKGSFRINAGEVRVMVGLPVSVEEYNKQSVGDLMRRIQAEMISHLKMQV